MSCVEVGSTDNLLVDLVAQRHGLTNNGLTVNGLTVNGLTVNGLAVNELINSQLVDSELSLAWLRDANEIGYDSRLFFAYLVSCALPSTAIVQVPRCRFNRCAAPDIGSPWSGDRNYSFAGEIGLAPEWAMGPCLSDCQEKVTSCLMARTNLYGKKVTISMRSPDLSPASQVEAETFNLSEGAFFGNIFDRTDPVNGGTLPDGEISRFLFVAAGVDAASALTVSRDCVAHSPSHPCLFQAAGWTDIAARDLAGKWYGPAIPICEGHSGQVFFHPETGYPNCNDSDGVNWGTITQRDWRPEFISRNWHHPISVFLDVPVQSRVQFPLPGGRIESPWGDVLEQ